MKHITAIVSVLIILIISPTLFAAGVIIDAKGKVNVTLPDGKSVPAKTGTELPDGTKISTDNNSSISIMLMNGAIEEIGIKQNYIVGAKEKEIKSKTVIQGLALAMNEATATSGGPTVHGMVKMTQLGPNAPKPVPISLGNVFGPEGIYPVGTTIEIPNKLTYVWKMDGKFNFSNPVIVIEDNSQKKLWVNKLSSTADKVTIKSKKMKLKPGKKYSWYLASRDNRKILGKSRRFNYSTLSDAEKNKLIRDSQKISTLNISQDGKEFLTAQLYYRAQMNDMMVETLLPLWEKNKTDAVKKLLYLGYIRMGQTHNALKYK